MNSGNGLSRNRSSSEAGTGVPARPEQEFQRGRNRSSSVSAGIRLHDGKSVHYSLFTYRQQIVDVVELSA